MRPPLPEPLPHSAGIRRPRGVLVENPQRLHGFG
jgi:hypothetical protein